MDWIQFTIFVLGNMVFTLTLWLWNRSESRNDHRQLETRVSALIEAIRQDMIDFHGRLCAIEEKTRNRK